MVNEARNPAEGHSEQDETGTHTVKVKEMIIPGRGTIGFLKGSWHWVPWIK
jgi:hypothetical protein